MASLHEILHSRPVHVIMLTACAVLTLNAFLDMRSAEKTLYATELEKVEILDAEGTPLYLADPDAPPGRSVRPGIESPITTSPPATVSRSYAYDLLIDAGSGSNIGGLPLDIAFTSHFRYHFDQGQDLLVSVHPETGDVLPFVELRARWGLLVARFLIYLALLYMLIFHVPSSVDGSNGDAGRN